MLLSKRVVVLAPALFASLLIGCGEDEADSTPDTSSGADTGVSADTGRGSDATLDTGAGLEPGPGAFAADYATSDAYFTLMSAAVAGSSPHGTARIWYSSNLQGVIEAGGPFEAPEGSVSIKEFDMAGDGEVDGLAVMIRQADGYFADGGDWLYEMRMLDGTVMTDEASGMPMSGPIAMCAGCHSGGASTSYLLGTTLR